MTSLVRSLLFRLFQTALVPPISCNPYQLWSGAEHEPLNSSKFAASSRLIRAVLVADGAPENHFTRVHRQCGKVASVDTPLNNGKI